MSDEERAAGSLKSPIFGRRQRDEMHREGHSSAGCLMPPSGAFRFRSSKKKTSFLYTASPLFISPIFSSQRFCWFKKKTLF